MKQQPLKKPREIPETEFQRKCRDRMLAHQAKIAALDRAHGAYPPPQQRQTR